jgi:membrane glycosyltransferase
LQIPEEAELPEIVQRCNRALEENRDLDCPPRRELFHRLLDNPVWLRSHLSMVESTAAAKPAPSATVEECIAFVRRNEWSELANSAKQAVLIDPVALAELHHTVWSMRSVQLMDQSRVSVQIQPSVAEVLAGEGR